MVLLLVKGCHVHHFIAFQQSVCDKIIFEESIYPHFLQMFSFLVFPADVWILDFLISEKKQLET